MQYYYILCRNRGMWGGMESPMKSKGKILVYTQKETCQAEVDRIRASQGNINNFNSYFVDTMTLNERERESERYEIINY